LAEKTITLNPNSALAYWLLGNIFTCAGRPDKGIEYLKKAIRLNPKPQGNYFHSLGFAYWMAGQDEKAIAMVKKALDQTPDSILCWSYLTAVYISSGQEDNARAAAKEILRIDSEFSVEPFGMRRPFKNRADRERFMYALRKAGLK